MARPDRLALLELGHLGGRRPLREPARLQVVPHEPAGHVHDLAAEADLVDVPKQDDVHQRLSTYGRSAISRARLTATATCSWWRRQAPVIRRERIFPFSEM